MACPTTNSITPLACHTQAFKSLATMSNVTISDLLADLSVVTQVIKYHVATTFFANISAIGAEKELVMSNGQTVKISALSATERT
jgi:hypothetical protein